MQAIDDLPDAVSGTWLDAVSADDDAARNRSFATHRAAVAAAESLERELRVVLPPHDGMARDCVARLGAMHRHFWGGARATRDDDAAAVRRPELRLALAVGGVWRPMRSSVVAVTVQLRSLGAGAMAFVLTKDPGGEPHGVALRNHDGVVLWVETQAPAGSRARTEPPSLLVDARVLVVAPTGQAVAPTVEPTESVDGLLHPSVEPLYGWNLWRRSGGGRLSEAEMAGAVDSVFSSPTRTVRATGSDGQPMSVMLRDIVGQVMPGSGHGVAFLREHTFQLTGRYSAAITTLPGETAHVAQESTHRPRPRLRLDGDFYVHAEGGNDGFVVPLRDGTHATVRPREFSTVLSHIDRLRALMQARPRLTLVLLSSGDHDAKNTALGLSREGMTVSLLTNNGPTTQLADGRFGVDDNQGWSIHTISSAPWHRSSHRPLGVYSDGNIDNIKFFERHLPTSRHIPDADPGAKAPLRGKNRYGDEVDFFPHEVAHVGLKTTGTGAARIGGVDLTGDRSELVEQMVEHLGRMTHVVRTLPGETDRHIRRSEWDNLHRHDENRRLVPVPWRPPTTPGPHKPDRDHLGPNVIIAHGHSRAVQITIERGGNEKRLSISGDTLIGLLIQLSQFQQMYAANPHGPVLLIICGTAQGNASVLTAAVKVARFLALHNTFIGARNEIVVYKHKNGPLLSVTDDAGFTISSNVHGRENTAIYGRYPEGTVQPPVGSG
ncbi:hypothetical protein HX744_21595 [Pseudonocardia sp. ICBG1122]|nr:hypothetical protein [Pseudonocardia pini]